MCLREEEREGGNKERDRKRERKRNIEMRGGRERDRKNMKKKNTQLNIFICWIYKQMWNK